MKQSEAKISILVLLFLNTKGKCRWCKHKHTLRKKYHFLICAIKNNPLVCNKFEFDKEKINVINSGIF